MEMREETDSRRPGVGAALLAFVVFALVAGASVVAARRQGVGVEAGWPKGSIRESADGSTVEMVSAMQRTDYRSEARALRKGEMVTIAGNGTLDLTGARMAGASSELEVVVI